MKIVRMTRSCGECPNYGYYSGGAYRCSLVDQTVLDKNRVAPFCPLPEYPDHIIASMQTSLFALQKPVADMAFGVRLLEYVAAKLKLPMSPSGSGIAIPTADGESVYLSLDFAKEIDVRPLRIRFPCDEHEYVLRVEGRDGPEQQQVVRREGIEEELFHRVEIKR